MTAEEFVKNFHLEKQNILNLCFDNKALHRSFISMKIEELNLDKLQSEKLKHIFSYLLKDTFYTILLGLDGSASIGKSQEVFKIYDENENLISEGGDLSGHAYEYFHGNEL